MARSNGGPATKHVDWGKYGLSTDEQQPLSQAVQQEDSDEEPLYQSEAKNQNELFAEDQSSKAKPWWKANFFLSEPVLFGTWDGVFTACMINIFGVIVFLRSGWMVGEAGIWFSVLVILSAVIVILISVLAGIGICERCAINRGGVYFLVSHVLGAKIGGSIGLIYCFGQAVGAALHSIGFGESIGKLLETDDIWIERGIAIALLVILVGINMAGVIWVVKLQFILLIILLLAALDFSVGSFVQSKPDVGVEGYYSYNFWNNSQPAYTEGNNWFTVFGVFFPTLTGVFAGINMSGDLRNPARDIPTGTLASVGVCTFLYLTFILILGATCKRDALLTDYLLAEKVSAIGVIFLAGLYIASASNCLATLYGTPRVLQSIANENVIPFIHILGKGRGPNQVPIISICMIAAVSVVFILVGEINTLAPIVTMPFMLTYAVIEYAYFSLTMSYKLWHKREQRLRSQGLLSPTFDNSKKFTNGRPSYGSTQEVPDLDKLFPERSKSKSKPQSQTHGSSQTSSLISSPDEHSSIKSEEPSGSLENAGTDDKDDGSIESLTDLSQLLPKGKSAYSGIDGFSTNWYSIFFNCWISLLGAFANLLIMFLVHWIYALAHVIVAAIIYFYIGQANPGVFPGVADFKLFPWLKNRILVLFGKAPSDYDQIVVTPMHPGIEVMAAQLTEDNEDYANRERYHQSSLVKNSNFNYENQ